MKKKPFIIILLFVFFFSCSCKQNKDNNMALFDELNISKKDITIDKILIDTIVLEKVESSYTGFIRFLDSTIIFIDQRFCWVYEFDLSGKLINRYLGQGRGPSEIGIKYIDAHVQFPNGDHLFIGSTNDAHLFNKQFLKLKDFTINWQSNYTDIYNIKNPPVSEPSLYLFEYEKFTLRSNSKSKVFAPIYSEHEDFNGCQSHDYYKSGRILAEIDIKGEKVIDLIGRRSREYLKYKYLGHHSYFSFDISEKDYFYITYEIDSLIYVYDVKFNPVCSFGYEGINMDKSYTELPFLDISKFRNLYFNDRPKKGYYNDVEYINELGLLFRSYKKGQHSETDGLQIYKENVLIADLDVIKDFSVAEYKKPFFIQREI